MMRNIEGLKILSLLALLFLELFEYLKIKIISSTNRTKSRTILFTLVVKVSVRSRTLKLHGVLSVCTPLGIDLVSWISIANQSRFTRSSFYVNHFGIKVIRYTPRVNILRPAQTGNSHFDTQTQQK